MRNVNCTVLRASDSLSADGIQIDANQLISASFHVYFDDTDAHGTLKLQVSNDICKNRYDAADFTVTNWTDLPNQSVNITSGASALLTVSNMAYRWIRAVYTSTGFGVQDAVFPADTGAYEKITITCPVFAAAHQGDYVVITNPSGASVALWLSIDGNNTPPTGAAYLAAGTKIKFSIVTGNTPAQIAAAMISAAPSFNGYTGVDNMDGTATYTSASIGTCLIPSTHNANDTTSGSFSRHVDVAGAPSFLNGTYFTLNSEGDATQYYVWFNVDGTGVDPAPDGLTPIEVDIAGGDSADTIGGIAATAIAAANASADFTASNTLGDVTITNKTAGPFTPGYDVTSGVMLTVTAGGSTAVYVNMNALGV